MSQAASFEVLYAFDENMNDGFKALLTAGGFNTKERGDKDELVTPYAAVDFVTGAARDQWKLMDDNSQRPKSFNGKLTIGFRTNRGVAAQDGVLKAYKANTRKLFYDIQTNFVEANFPYYQVQRMMEAGTSPTLEAENDLDISGMEWDVIFGIRADAWPE